MPSQTDYLAVVGVNPGSSAEKIYALVNLCPTVAAADTMLRKLASKGLLIAESTSPRSYSLTDKGKQSSTLFLGHRWKDDSPLSRGVDTPVSSPVQRVRALLERLTADEAKAINSDAPSEKKTRREIKRGMLELLAFDSERRGKSKNSRKGVVRPTTPRFAETQAPLREQVGNEEMVRKIERLAKVEAELCEQKGWWGDESEAERLENEIAELKEQLGLSEVAVRLEE